MAIAAAMTGIAIGNIASIQFFVMAVTHSPKSIDRAPYAIIVGLVFLLELAFVRLVQSRVRDDPVFAPQVASASPTISTWYAVLSGVLFVASSAAMALSS